MDFLTTARNIGALVLLATVLTACDGGGSTKAVKPNTPTANTATSNDSGLVSVSGKADAGSTITVTFPDGSQQTTIANSAGNYSLTSNKAQTSGTITISSTDSQGNKSANSSIKFTADLDNPNTIKAIYLATGTMPELSFKPSLGINTEGPQGGADTAGMPMPFVDIFRTARPFAELSPENTIYDDNGWPMEFSQNLKYARTKMLQGALDDSIPEGKYTVLYDGSGRLEFGSSGAVTNVADEGNNKLTFDLTLRDFDSEDEQDASSLNSFNMNIRDISPNSYMKNIRIVMPGGTCTGNPFIRVDETDTCPNGTSYESFAERLEADRNAIIFNPDYLMFLRNFKVIRMMNLMEASLKRLCFSADACPEGVGTWDHRATMEDAVWGGNDGRTADEEHKGVPIKVMIALANTLNRDIWLNIPHIATDDYISKYAQQVKAGLAPTLKVYVEYSNEVWNNGFAAHAYSTSEGKRLGLDEVPDEFVGTNRDENYFARLRFYSKRSVEIFRIWKNVFDNDERIIRVLGSFIGDRILTEKMLENVTTADIDAVAIGAYFFGCPYEAICPNAAKTLKDATTVDDVFDVIDQSRDVDVKSLDGTLMAVENQLTVTKTYNLDLVTYEGGQHLVPGVFGSGAGIDDADRKRLRKLFNDANRDPRMKQRYIRFMEGWKALVNEGTTLFTLYTMPQSFYRYGNFGIKEHLNKSRAESPKYDGIMTFQETVGNCWWEESGCTP